MSLKIEIDDSLRQVEDGFDGEGDAEDTDEDEDEDDETNDKEQMDQFMWGVLIIQFIFIGIFIGIGIGVDAVMTAAFYFLNVSFVDLYLSAIFYFSPYSTSTHYPPIPQSHCHTYRADIYERLIQKFINENGQNPSEEDIEAMKAQAADLAAQIIGAYVCTYINILPHTAPWNYFYSWGHFVFFLFLNSLFLLLRGRISLISYPDRFILRLFAFILSLCFLGL